MDPGEIRARLTLPGVPVLLPWEVDTPLQGGRGGTERASLSAYLTTHTMGYVQLYDLTPGFTYKGTYDTLLLTLDAVAADRSVATALAATVRRQLSSTPRTGGNITTFMPERAETLPAGVTRVTVQFEVRQARTQE